MSPILGALALFLAAVLHAQPAPDGPGISGQEMDKNRTGWVTPAVRAPRVTFHTFASAAAKTDVSFHLYTPEAHDLDKEHRFPVLYWLHGTGGGLAGIRPLAAWFDAAIRERKMPPVFVVFPNGLATSMWCDSKDGAVPMETVVIKELVPHVDASFRTVTKREARLIEGFSMGGYGAARLGLKYPDLFGGVSCLAGGPLDLDFQGPRTKANPAERESILGATFGGDIDYFRELSPLTIAEKNAETIGGRLRMRVAVGASDFTAALNKALSEHLKKTGIAHTFTTVPDVGHDTLALLKGMGEPNWEFYRAVFEATTSKTKPPTPSP